MQRTCDHHALLPRSLKVTVIPNNCWDSLDKVEYPDLWKQVFRGQDVAVKAIRANPGSGLQKVVDLVAGHASRLRAPC